MKKLSVLVMSVLMVGTILTGCGGSSESGSGKVDGSQAETSNSQEEKENSQQAVEDTTPTGYWMAVKGTNVVMNAEMAPVVEALGEPDSYFESDSCAFQGKDKVYTYGSVKITTYPLEEVDYVYTVELMDDTVTTTEGVYVGASKDDVIAAYGEAATTSDTALIYEKDDSRLTFILEGGSVKNIVYMAITE